VRFVDFLRQSGCGKQKSAGSPSVRRHEVWHCGPKPMKAFAGHFPRHLLILVRTGAAAYRRDGCTTLADAGDALLVDSGDGEIEFFESNSCIMATILEFDARAIARMLRAAAAIESIAMAVGPFIPSGVAIRNFTTRLGPRERLFINGCDHIFAPLFLEFNRGVPEFARTHFYAPRWALLNLLERNVWFADGVERIEKVYGAKKLRRDSLLFIGAKPAQVFLRRRLQLATGFLQCGHSISDVAKTFGFCSAWHFECAYSGSAGRRCKDVQNELSLKDADPERLLSAIVPNWWEGRKTNLELPPRGERLFPASLMSEKMERAWIEYAAARGEYPLDQLRAEREAATKALREKAQSFFDMKGTAANIAVPIFKDEAFSNPLAA
jgi:hypothetical protein